MTIKRGILKDAPKIKRYQGAPFYKCTLEENFRDQGVNKKAKYVLNIHQGLIDFFKSNFKVGDQLVVRGSIYAMSDIDPRTKKPYNFTVIKANRFFTMDDYIYKNQNNICLYCDQEIKNEATR